MYTQCDQCPRRFKTEEACNQHMRDTNHFAFECAVCDQTLPTEKDRTHHEAAEHFYCSQCLRLFRSANDIRMHFRSRVHLGASVGCPFCKRDFTTATGLVHHLETGRCKNAPHLDHDQLYRFVSARDPQGLISKHVPNWKGTTQFEATEMAWNGNAYECYLCHHEFRLLHSLNQHLNSPRHHQYLYQCPSNTCTTEFKSLAGLINHLESEACKYIRFNKLQKQIGTLINSNRMISFH